jgi:prevent-host-death family protein
MASSGAYTQIGAFEAKTKLSEILRRVEAGERFTITVRGRAVADVGPSQDRASSARAEALERLRFPRITGIPAEEIQAAIREGRR